MGIAELSDNNTWNKCVWKSFIVDSFSIYIEKAKLAHHVLKLLHS